MNLLQNAYNKILSGLSGFKWVLTGWVIILISAGLFVVGFFMKSPAVPELTFSQNIGNLFWEAGKLGITGVLIGTLVKVAYSLRFMDAALEHIMWTDDYLKGRKNVDDLWVRLTAHLYLAEHNLGEIDESDFVKRFKSTLSSRLRNEKNYYTKGLTRTMVLSWEDEEKEIVKLHETHSFRIFSQSDEKVVISSKVRALGSASPDDYAISKDTVSVTIPGQSTPYEPKTSTVQAEDYWVTEYELSGSSEYEVLRTREVIWSLIADPSLTINASTICDGLTLVIDCQPTNIRTVFREAPGTQMMTNLLNPKQMEIRKGDQERKFDGIWLPGDGCSFFFEKV